MNSIERLLPDSPIFDRESLTRDVLMSELKTWLSCSFFSKCDLVKIRDLVRDLQGLPEQSLGHRLRAMPVDLDRLHCMKFDELSSTSRRGVLGLAFEYAGLTPDVGPELLGTKRWMEIVALVDACVTGHANSPEYERTVQGKTREAPELSTPSGSASGADPWTQEVLTTSVLGLVDGPYFDKCHLDRAGTALNALRKTLGMTWFDDGSLTQMAALRALHCKRFAEMSSVIRQSLPEAILTALGLHDADARALLGSEGWSKVQTRYADPWPDPIIEEPKVAAPCVPIASRPRSAWQRFLRRPVRAV